MNPGSSGSLSLRRWRDLDEVYIDVYTSTMSGTRAKLFQNGGSQAVRLPKSCRFPAQGEVVARREGRRVILEPVDEWSEEFRACLGAWREEIPRPVQRPVRDLRNPFA
jgi:antitoxin VapB